MKEQLEQATISGLYYYPIKSCKGIAVDTAQVIETGILHDRELLIVDAATNQFYTQRELPKMALLAPRIEDNYLELTAPNMPVLKIPLQAEGKPLTVTVWQSVCETVDQGETVAEWLGDFLGVKTRLVRMQNDFKRRIDPKFALDSENSVSFADGYPILLISEESLADLNSRMEVALPMNRFRPNIVISGSNVAFGEDYIVRAKLGEVIFKVVKPCARCQITTTDQITTEVGKEPLRTLATFRRGKGGGVLFGQNVIAENQGTLKVGDKLEVYEISDKMNWL
jgi:uncharacterized protein